MIRTNRFKLGYYTLKLPRMAPPGAKSALVPLSATKFAPELGLDKTDIFSATFRDAKFFEVSGQPVREEEEGGDTPVVLEEPERPVGPPPGGPQPEGEPQREPGDEPQREPGDEQQDEPLLLAHPEDGKAPLPPSTGTGITADSPELLLAMGLIGAAMVAALGGTLLVPARRKH